jgi:hypothetical protein
VTNDDLPDAAFASWSSKTRSRTGRSCAPAIARFITSVSLRLPTPMVSYRLAQEQLEEAFEPLPCGDSSLPRGDTVVVTQERLALRCLAPWRRRAAEHTVAARGRGGRRSIAALHSRT